MDLSEATPATVATAVSFARSCDAQIVFLHVIPPPMENLLYPASNDGAWDRALAVAQSELKELIASIKVPVSMSAEAVLGFPVETILTRARDCQADVIVMGSHGHGSVYDLLVGRTSSGVLKGAHCPVLITPVKHDVSSRRPSTVSAA